MDFVRDILLQAVLILIMVVMFLGLYNVPQKYLSKLRYRNKGQIQAKRHFVKGAQLLAQARSAKDRHDATKLAADAVAEADKSILLDPKDAASHILKALALDLQGYKTSALDSLDVALSPLAAASLAGVERGDALLKRAEIRMEVSRRGRVDSAVAADLEEAVKLSPENGKAWRVLGECYEAKKMKEEAKKAFEQALRVQPNSAPARDGLNRLNS